MMSNATMTRDQVASAYLGQLEALAAELDAAIQAVATNAIGRLQESVSKQEMLCAGLAKMAGVVSAEPWTVDAGNKGLASGPKEDLEEKIRSAKARIFNLTLRYAALLKHSGDSIALLASLCRSHTGQFQETRGPRLKHQTWSCEM
jgi:hypothetical protein